MSVSRAMVVFGLLLGAGCAAQVADPGNEDYGATALGLFGDLDPSFGTNGVAAHNLDLEQAGASPAAGALQPDGRVLLVGNNWDGLEHLGKVARLNADGSVDGSFGRDGNGVVEIFGAAGVYLNDVALQPDGKIVAVGAMRTGRSTDVLVLRLLPDGRLDSSFRGGMATFSLGDANDAAHGVALQDDGAIVVTGTSYDADIGNDNLFVARVRADGWLDTGFGPGGFITRDVAGGADSGVDVVIQDNQRIVVAAAVTTRRGASFFAVLRFYTGGSLDSSFAGDGVQMVSFTGRDTPTSMALLGDGGVVVAGYTWVSATGGADFAVLRLTSTGYRDYGFSDDGRVTTPIGTNDRAFDVMVDSAERIVVVGEAYQGSGSDYDMAVARYRANGMLDTSFSRDGKATVPVGTGADTAGGVMLGAADAIVATGRRTRGAGDSRFAAIRLHDDGGLDASFDDDGKADLPFGTQDDVIEDLARQTDGRLVATGWVDGGSFIRCFVARFESDGSLDTSFADGGRKMIGFGIEDAECRAVALQTDGKIVVVGETGRFPNRRFAVARLHASGAFDTSFAGNGRTTTPVGTAESMASDVVLQPDGRIVVGGTASPGSSPGFAAVRYLSTGVLDTSFGTGGKAMRDVTLGHDGATRMALRSDGRIVLVGVADRQLALVGFTANGGFDTTFGIWGVVRRSVGSEGTFGSDVAITGTGRIVVAAEVRNGVFGPSEFGALRFLANGAADTSFSGDGLVTTSLELISRPRALQIQSDGRIILAGATTSDPFRGPAKIALVRYRSDGALDTTFSGDGKATVTIGDQAAAHALVLQADGRIVTGGPSGGGGPGVDATLVRYENTVTPVFRVFQRRTFSVMSWR